MVACEWYAINPVVSSGESASIGVKINYLVVDKQKNTEVNCLMGIILRLR